MLAKHFAEKSNEVAETVFACLDDVGELGEGLRRDGYLVEVLHRKPGIDLRLSRRLAAFLRQQKVDVVHAHQYAPFFYAALARAPFLKPAILFTEHGRHFPDVRSVKRVVVNRFLLRRRDHVVAVGEQVKQALIDNEGLPAERIEVIHNGVSIADFDVPSMTREDARSQLQVLEPVFVIAQVARLNRLKDHLTAVAAMEMLLHQHPLCQLWIVGEGEERAHIEKAIADKNLGDSVQLFGSRKDIPAILRAADAFLLTSVSEGIPLTLIEAMASGLPCVATSVGGIPEVIRHEATGFLSSAGNANSLARQLARLVGEPELRKKIAVEGQKSVRERFSDEQMHRRYQALYRQLSSLRPRSQI
jgi:glycosyltransferase involved in cell wall biosynthesis